MIMLCMDILLHKTTPTKSQLCHIRSSTLHLVTTLRQSCHSLVTVSIPRLSQCGDKLVTTLFQSCHQVVINLINKLVTTSYKLVFSVWKCTMAKPWYIENIHVYKNLFICLKITLSFKCRKDWLSQDQSHSYNIH